MEELIRDMIEHADRHHDTFMAKSIYRLLSIIAVTDDCPPEWFDLPGILAEEYNGSNWLDENCKLYEFR